MKLRVKVPLFFLVIVVIFIILIHYILNSVVLTSYVQLEREEAFKVSERLQQSIQDKFTILESKSSDWANWDDANEFVQNNNPKFIESNIQNQSLASLNIDLMIFYNNSGDIVFSKFYDTTNNVDLPLPSYWQSSQIRTVNPTTVDQTNNKLGFINVDGQILLIVKRQILTSNAEGPSFGTLIFGQILDNEEVLNLEKIQKNPLDYRLYSDINLPHDYIGAKSHYAQEQTAYILSESEEHVDVYTIFNDIEGNPLLIFEEKINRQIYLYGKRNTLITELLIVGVGLGTAIVAIIFLLNRLILERLERLTKEIQKIGPAGLLSARVSSYGKDELGLLAEEFNQTLRNLETITDEKLYQERQSQSLLSVMEEAVIVTNEFNSISYTNPACESYFGTLSEEYYAKKIGEVLKFSTMNNKPLAPTYLEDLPKSTEVNKRVTIYVEGKTKKRAVIITFAPVIVERIPKGYIYVFHDITQEVQINQQKDDFFSIASHELRTPLTVISGNLDNILQGYGKSALSELDKKALADAINSSDRLIRLVNDYLNVSRLDQGRVVLNSKPVDMCTLIESISTEMEPLFSKKGIAYKRMCEGNHGLVMGDEDKIKEVIINLLGNSLKFTHHGEISIRHTVKDGMLVTDVIDTGIGIAKEKQHLLFARFQQAMNTTMARQAGGTGLGLYISREFIKLMGGEMWLKESEPDQGSTFSFTLPFAKE